MLMENEWILLNSLVSDIHTIKNEKQMRRRLMERLSFLIDYDFGSFYRRLPVENLEFGDFIVYSTQGREIKPEVERSILEYQDNYRKYDYVGNLLSSGENLIYRETDVMPDEMRFPHS